MLQENPMDPFFAQMHAQNWVSPSAIPWDGWGFLDAELYGLHQGGVGWLWMWVGHIIPYHITLIFNILLRPWGIRVLCSMPICPCLGCSSSYLEEEKGRWESIFTNHGFDWLLPRHHPSNPPMGNWNKASSTIMDWCMPLQYPHDYHKEVHTFIYENVSIYRLPPLRSRRCSSSWVFSWWLIIIIMHTQ